MGRGKLGILATIAIQSDLITYLDNMEAQTVIHGPYLMLETLRMREGGRGST